MTEPDLGHPDIAALKWAKAQRCDTNTCVEVADAETAPVVFLRDSKNPDGPVLSFPAEDWEEWQNEVPAGRHRFQWAWKGAVDEEEQDGLGPKLAM